MQCVILAGGLGTRMQPLTRRLPKALLPVLGRPFAEYQLGWLADQRVRSVIYCIGFLGEQIRAFVGDGARWGLRVAYVDEGSLLMGTGGALRLASDAGVLERGFLVLYGKQTGLNFANTRDAVRLFFRTGALLEEFHYTRTWDDRSYSKTQDGGQAWTIWYPPSPGLPNRP